MTLASVYSSNPSRPISRPLPDCLYPPNGASAAYQTPPLTLTVPTRNRAAILGRPFGVGAEHRARQAVRRVVGDAHGVVVAVVGDHREHRPEDLLARDPGVVGEPADHGGLDEETLRPVGGAPTATGELAALVEREIQVGLHPVALARRDHRTAHRALVGRVAGLDRTHGGRGGLDRFVIAGAGHHQPGGDRAALPGVHRRGER